MPQRVKKYFQSCMLLSILIVGLFFFSVLEELYLPSHTATWELSTDAAVIESGNSGVS